MLAGGSAGEALAWRAATRTICFVSDRTGVTAESLGHAAVAIRRHDVSTASRCRSCSTWLRPEAWSRASTRSRRRARAPIVFCTIVDQETRAVIKQARALVIDIFSTFVGQLEAELGEARGAAGAPAMHGAKTDPTYAARIDATNYALANDDGAGARDYRSANVVLRRRIALGQDPDFAVSRAAVRRVRGELPARGGRARGRQLPRALVPHRQKLYGLISSRSACSRFAASGGRAAATRRRSRCNTSCARRRRCSTVSACRISTSPNAASRKSRAASWISWLCAPRAQLKCDYFARRPSHSSRCAKQTRCRARSGSRSSTGWRH